MFLHPPAEPGDTPAASAASDWFKSAVVYQIYPRSFADSNGDGIGDLRGITGKLDYLNHLGVDVVWLSPIYSSPQDDNGYDISDYRAVDRIFGSLDDLDELIRGLHHRGMKLVMDLVVNHTSDEHPWFLESRSSMSSPKRDWYFWRPPREGFEAGAAGAEANDWGSSFSGPAWELDPNSGEYYLHLFSRKQVDLNWDNRDVRAAIYEMMNWWLDRGVDGFRMDVINYIDKHPGLPDGGITGGQQYGDGSPYFTSGPRVHDYLQEMHEQVFSRRVGTYLTIGEMPGVTTDDARQFTDPARRELDMVFQFEHMAIDLVGGSKWSPTTLDLPTFKRTLERWDLALSTTGWNSLYWGNHDQARAVSRFGDDGRFRATSAKMLAGILLLHRGTPFIYQGEELGMTNAVFNSISDHRDIEVLNYHSVSTASEVLSTAEVLSTVSRMNRDNARTPFHWDSTRHGGFSTGTPWIGVNPNYPDINAEVQFGDPDSVFNFYRRLIRLRRSHAVFSHGDCQLLLPEDPHIYAFRRWLDDTELLVLGNFSGLNQEPSIEDQDWASAELLLSNYPADTGLALKPWGLKVLRR